MVLPPHRPYRVKKNARLPHALRSRLPLALATAGALAPRPNPRRPLSPPHAIVALPPPPPAPLPSPALVGSSPPPCLPRTPPWTQLRCRRRTCSPTACRQSHGRRGTHPLRHRSTSTAPLSSLLVHGPPRLIPASRAADERGDAPLSPNPRAAPGSPASSQPRAASSPNARSSLALRPRKVPLAQPAAVPHSPASRGASPPTCSQPSLSPASRGASPPTRGRPSLSPTSRGHLPQPAAGSELSGIVAAAVPAPVAAAEGGDGMAVQASGGANGGGRPAPRPSARQRASGDGGHHHRRAKAYCFRLPLVLGFRDFFHGIDKPAAQKVSNGLRALFNSVKILAISVTFSSKKNMESVMKLLKCFPFLETLHILGNKRREGEVHTIGPNN
ncbi:hypothetical protein PAHAL_3G203900 [Panicum hallii]|uniref:F-box/LRR-repeat protein 15/At3g58940/PEG3-like LRR domain-containing protein n=2 Tax=Panicum hallii TaxID=206008 RepID=A0A2T8KIX8_9POAL|nr:hypothetical protein PAHAL_3G203900 [Panicum hallii]